MEKFFRPKLIDTLKTYNRKTITNDLFVGIIVGVVALPLAIAFAISSGVSPEKGLLNAVVAGFIIATMGGSRVQIGDPTGAFIVIVYGIVLAAFLFTRNMIKFSGVSTDTSEIEDEDFGYDLE